MDPCGNNLSRNVSCSEFYPFNELVLGFFKTNKAP
jgi:hypothetical protein